MAVRGMPIRTPATWCGTPARPWPGPKPRSGGSARRWATPPASPIARSRRGRGGAVGDAAGQSDRASQEALEAQQRAVLEASRAQEQAVAAAEQAVIRAIAATRLTPRKR